MGRIEERCCMKEKLHLRQNLLVGSLLFGLFFGAGNLIFPVQMGQAAGNHTLPAMIGFLITGVGLPVLGVVASALSGSESLFDMAKPVSSGYAVLFTCALYLTIGPLFAIPRTATVAFEVGLHPFVSGEQIKPGLFLFSLAFFSLTVFFTLRPSRIMDWIGKYLTPAFLILLSVLLITVFAKPMGDASIFPPQGNYRAKSFFTGLLDGYNTMDALASLAFAIIIISGIQNLGVRKPHSIAVETCKSGLVSVFLMGIIYAALAYMGAASPGSISRADNGGLILSMVSRHYFGIPGQVLLAAIVAVACLKTAIGLITACSEMFCKLFPKSVSYRGYVTLFTLLSFFIANFGLNNIIQWSVPILMFLYPLAITLILLSLLAPWIHRQRDIYRWTTGFAGIAAFFDFCKAFPKPFQELPAVKHLVQFAERILPGFGLGFGWIVPAFCGFFIGWILRRICKRESPV